MSALRRIVLRVVFAGVLGLGAAVAVNRRARRPAMVTTPRPWPTPALAPAQAPAVVEAAVEADVVEEPAPPEPVAEPAPAARRSTSPARWLGRVVLFATLGAGTAVMLAVLVPLVLGMRSYTVMSGSMEPAIDTGDVVVERTLAPEQMRPGDVVTFRDPTRHNRLITHRVRQVSIGSGVVRVVTRGDANTGVERWSVPVRGSVGLVIYRLPRIGYAAHFMAGTDGRLLFVVLPVLLIGLTLLIDVWRRPPAAALGEPAT